MPAGPDPYELYIEAIRSLFLYFFSVPQVLSKVQLAELAVEAEDHVAFRGQDGANLAGAAANLELFALLEFQGLAAAGDTVLQPDPPDAVLFVVGEARDDGELGEIKFSRWRDLTGRCVPPCVAGEFLPRVGFGT